MANKEGNWFVRHKILTGIIILVVIGMIASAANPNSTPTKVGDNASGTTQEKTQFATGEVIAFDGKEVTVATAERNWDSGNQFIKPESGKEFVKVQVTIENKSDSEASYNTFDWKLQDSQGVIKDVDSSAFVADGALNSGNLAPNGKVSGFLVFQVPAGDSGLVLRYSPSFWSDKKVEIKL